LRTLIGGSRDSPPRLRTLRDSIEWSYNLLDSNEKVLFARLAVFAGDVLWKPSKVSLTLIWRLRRWTVWPRWWRRI
jgi:predicted ATPase